MYGDVKEGMVASKRSVPYFTESIEESHVLIIV
jgi:hypothetical protein